ncbi:MAG: hypothetical protein PHW40_02875 [Candidatus Izemoplasmatales bacterium]|jgi:hypothetical protein|nr:hypothetical protein [Candidatus Izemoplasmatales bacterium]
MNDPNPKYKQFDFISRKISNSLLYIGSFWDKIDKNICIFIDPYASDRLKTLNRAYFLFFGPSVSRGPGHGGLESFQRKKHSIAKQTGSLKIRFVRYRLSSRARRPKNVGKDDAFVHMGDGRMMILFDT